MARAWTAAGAGSAVVLTIPNNARNATREEAVRHGVTFHELARWLGHSDACREDLTPMAVTPGSLIVVDEALMVPMGDLAAIVSRADWHGAKVAVTGDALQLQAPEGGGGMDRLDRYLGHVELSDPQPAHPDMGTPGHAAAAAGRHHRAGRLPRT